MFYYVYEGAGQKLRNKSANTVAVTDDEKIAHPDILTNTQI